MLFRSLIQGLNRQIRRMCEYFGYEVIKLERVRIMNITLKGLALGEWRDLTADELAGIYQMTASSSSEVDKKISNAHHGQGKNEKKNRVSVNPKTSDKPVRNNPDLRNRKNKRAASGHSSTKRRGGR